MNERARIEVRLRQAGLSGLDRNSWLEIELDTVAANVWALSRLVPKGTAIASVVKADGYGHGIEGAAYAALAGGATMLVVATLDEALALRGAGFDCRVLVLYPMPVDGFIQAVSAGIDVVAFDATSSALRAALAEHPRLRDNVRLHLGIETGLARGGVRPQDAGRSAMRLMSMGLHALAGTWSHLASPGDPDFTERQVRAFRRALRAIALVGLSPGIRHLGATGALLAGTRPTWEMVRIGIAAFGYVPSDLTPSAEAALVMSRIRPAMTLRARAVAIQEIASGASVGYGGDWSAERPSRIAPLPVGYADGWARAYGRDTCVSISGRPAPVVGRVGSDALAIDVTDHPGFGPHDEVVIFGQPGTSTADRLAGLRGTINIEVLDSFGPRLPRVYTVAGVPVAVRAGNRVMEFSPAFRHDAIARPGTAAMTA